MDWYALAVVALVMVYAGTVSVAFSKLSARVRHLERAAGLESAEQDEA